MAVNFSNEINQLQKAPVIGRYLAAALNGIQDGLNNLATNMAASASSASLPPPPPIQSLTVKTDGSGNVHAVISDASQIQRGINYYVEADTDPNFTRPHVYDLHSSRTFGPLPFPAKDDNGDPQTFHFRGYSGYRGGPSSRPINYGGSTPTPVSPGGSGQATLLPSTGSGSASNSGQEGGSGAGRFLLRKQT